MPPKKNVSNVSPEPSQSAKAMRANDSSRKFVPPGPLQTFASTTSSYQSKNKPPAKVNDDYDDDDSDDNIVDSLISKRGVKSSTAKGVQSSTSNNKISAKKTAVNAKNPGNKTLHLTVDDEEDGDEDIEDEEEESAMEDKKSGIKKGRKPLSRGYKPLENLCGLDEYIRYNLHKNETNDFGWQKVQASMAKYFTTRTMDVVKLHFAILQRVATALHSELSIRFGEQFEVPPFPVKREYDEEDEIEAEAAFKAEVGEWYSSIKPFVDEGLEIVQSPQFLKSTKSSKKWFDSSVVARLLRIAKESMEKDDVDELLNLDKDVHSEKVDLRTIQSKTYKEIQQSETRRNEEVVTALHQSNKNYEASLAQSQKLTEGLLNYLNKEQVPSNPEPLQPTNVDERLGALNEKVNTVGSEVQVMNNKVGSLDTRVGSLDTKVGSLDTKVDAILSILRPNPK